MGAQRSAAERSGAAQSAMISGAEWGGVVQYCVHGNLFICSVSATKVNTNFRYNVLFGRKRMQRLVCSGAVYLCVCYRNGFCSSDLHALFAIRWLCVTDNGSSRGERGFS